MSIFPMTKAKAKKEFDYEEKLEIFNEINKDKSTPKKKVVFLELKDLEGNKKEIKSFPLEDKFEFKRIKIFY